MAALSTALMALTAANTVNGFVGQRRAAKGAIAQGNYEAGVAEQNASLAEQQAADAIVRGNEASSRHRTATKQLGGSQRASLAASGIAIDSGSALDIQHETQAMGELDRMTIENNARREAWGFKVQAQNYRAGGNLAQFASQNTAAGLRNQSHGTLLTGATQIADIASRYPRPKKKN